MKRLITKVLKITAVVAVVLTVSSCHTPKDVTYFQDLKDNVVISPATSGAIKIQPKDKLSIVVKSKDPELANLFNLTVNTDRTSGGTSASATGVKTLSYSGSTEGMSNYTVAPDGTIDFPVLGKLKVTGMNRSELAGFIKGELMGKDLVKDPVVTVEFLNTGFSVLGEVNRPGRIDMNVDELNILQALALAGDLSIQGQRENVAVIRQEADGMHTYRMDLTNMSELSKSPAFYKTGRCDLCGAK